MGSSEDINNKISGKLSGRIFVFTGTLSEFTRDEAGEIVKSLGGTVSNSISSKTDFLVSGDKPGSKIKKAEKLGIKIIDENEFKELANN